MTNYPTSLDQFNNPTSSTKTNAAGFDHAEQHTNVNDAVESLQAKVGINLSSNVNSIDYKIRRLLSRQLTVEQIGTGNGVITEFVLAFSPIGSVMVMDNNTRITATLIEPTPGEFTVVCATAPIGVVSIIAIKEIMV